MHAIRGHVNTSRPHLTQVSVTRYYLLALIVSIDKLDRTPIVLVMVTLLCRHGRCISRDGRWLVEQAIFFVQFYS